MAVATLKINNKKGQGTYLKAWPYSSAQLKEDKVKRQLSKLANGRTLKLDDFEDFTGNGFEGGSTAPHYAIQLDQPIDGCRRWFIFAEHAALIENAIAERAAPNIVVAEDDKKAIAKTVANMSEAALKDEKAAKKDLGKLIKFPELPSLGRGRYMLEPMLRYPDGSYSSFTWAELLQNDARRKPIKQWELNNLMKLVKWMDHLRREFAQPLVITSGPRPEPINREIGGARGSWHTKFSAADFYPGTDGITAAVWRKICQLQKSDGLACGSQFIHTEHPGARGYYSFWEYGGAPSFARVRY